MLVKIAALGLNPAVWKNVFHHLRTGLPDHPFAAGIFTSPEEWAYLTRGFYPHQWRREGIDYVLVEASGGAEWKRRMDFVRRLGELPQSERPTLALVLSALEQGLGQLVQGPLPVELELDNAARFALRDPAFLVATAPKDFPRLRVNEYLTGLRFATPGGRGRPAAQGRAHAGPPQGAGFHQPTAQQQTAVSPHNLAPGMLVGFSELSAVVMGAEEVEPEVWLRGTLKAAKIKLPPGGCPGLIREGKGLFLCPGLPLRRIRAVIVDGVEFPQLLDLGQLNARSRHFKSLRDSVRQRGNEHRERHEAQNARLRQAENKTDLPVVCAGGAPMVRETLADRLAARGFRRCSTLESPESGEFREPALLLELSPFSAGNLVGYVEEPLRVPLSDSLDALLEPLQGLIDWQGLAFHPLTGKEVATTPADYHRLAEDLALRSRKATAGKVQAQNRRLLLRQEIDVLDAALAKLTELLEADEALTVWSGTLPPGAKQVLVFSHDPEEAGAVLQALGAVGRKRWFDLSPYSEAEALRTLSLEPLREYRDQGAMVITAASRERLRTLRSQLSAQRQQARADLTDSEEAARFFVAEQGKSGSAAEELARRWLRDALGAWLDQHMEDLSERLQVLRRRHERRWFSRALVNRVALAPSNGDNRVALLQACDALFPGFKKDHSLMVHYDFEPLDVLPTPQPHGGADSGADSGADGDPARPAGQAPSGSSAGTLPPGADGPGRRNLPPALAVQALEEHNQALFEHYLQAATSELAEHKADLLVIEHRRRWAFAILDHLRRSLPALAEVPAVLIIPDDWAPAADEALPWPRTRVLVLPRMGPLTTEECTRGLRTLFSA